MAIIILNCGERMIDILWTLSQSRFRDEKSVEVNFADFAVCRMFESENSANVFILCGKFVRARSNTKSNGSQPSATLLGLAPYPSEWLEAYPITRQVHVPT